MSTGSPNPSRNRWLAPAIALTVLIALLSVATGFLWLPSLQSRAGFRSVWDAFCSAAGLVYNRAPTAVERSPGYITSTVTILPGMLSRASADSVGRGATLALQCTVCHGARGVSNADTPNLAGQYAPAIYKELLDYQSGARTSAIMSPRVSNLSEQDIRELAAYYAYLPRLPAYHSIADKPTPQLVLSGAPMRNIAPCAACHGAMDYKTGSAWLEGESSVYLRTQLHAFASGARHNDISEQMRNVARGMTSAEIEQTAAYYASQPK
jgi:cytochrome c553